MSILINGMEMPLEKSRVIQIYPDGTVRRLDGSIFNSHFEAVPVPPHGDLIDRDALCKTLRSLAENEYTPEVFANWIENHSDTIIEAEGGE